MKIKYFNMQLLKYTIAGAIGFVIGNMVILPAGIFDIAFRTFFTLGSITCGIALGIASKSLKQVLRLALAGIVWFVVGWVLYRPFLFITVVLEIYGIICVSAIMGMIGGALFGLIAKKKKDSLIFANGIGFIIATLISGYIGYKYGVSGHVCILIFSLIVGASLGIGLYLAEKKVEL